MRGRMSIPEVDAGMGARSPITVGSIPSADATERWRPVERAEAEARLGAPLVSVPGLPILAYEVGILEGGPVVRVLQELEDGVLTLVERRVLPDIDSPAAEEEPDSTSVTLVVGEVEVTASASLSTEALRELLDRVR